MDHRIGRTSGMVLEAPQPSLTWSFMLGVLMARRWAADLLCSVDYRRT